MPTVGTLSGIPPVQGTSELSFVLFLPSSAKPAGGYPVAIWAAGGAADKRGGSGTVAAKLAQQGVATIAIDRPGNGFGPFSTHTLTLTDSSSVTVSAGGRGIDQNGDGSIENAEGFFAAAARIIQRGRDGERQWAADLMQLVREIQVGMDVDGDTVADLDDSRVYYGGSSAGGNLGPSFLAIEPSVRAGALAVPGGSPELGRLTVNRGGVLGEALQSRVPSLINAPGMRAWTSCP